ncbi:MAG: hypothetical protein K2X71_11690 [Methylobacterium sp.]|uniref:hypothetical protein n=1 Tax=Methylobacterium sp. TaxID=409 RepID=UPI0025832FB7|nr:hypothetical protein [Methylobacterium sp.]MBY0296688.1 hypothetical protein [Methylobacterium sp.]
MAAPQAWTVEAVKRRLREAERAATRRPPDPALQAALRWPDLYIREHGTRQYLKAWIWCEAHGESFTQLCRGRAGWSARTGSRRVAEALATIAALLTFAEAAPDGTALAAEGRIGPATPERLVAGGARARRSTHTTQPLRSAGDGGGTGR